MIRPANEDDFYEIERQAAKFWQETAFAESTPYVTGSAYFYIELAYNCGLLFVYEQNDKVVGFSAGCYSQLMGDENVLSGTELALWIEPNYRKGRAGIQLLTALEDAAKKIGCRYWNMVVMDSSIPNRISNLYKKMGYSKQETTWSKEL